VVSDQRMPQMPGTEFLRAVQQMHPDSVRLILSGYADVEAVSAALNEGVVYKFFSKPWDDNQLRTEIREAFQYYKALAGIELEPSSNGLPFRFQYPSPPDPRVEAQQLAWRMSQTILSHLPMALLGIDREGLIVYANQHCAQLVGGHGKGLIGRVVSELFVDTWLLSPGLDGYRERRPVHITHVDGRQFDAWAVTVEQDSGSAGLLLTILEWPGVSNS
ncbi:response regulator, partial [Sedimenticola sp.]|uniref:response regulator n=1 Tax=Sedimenticola sp. TaxID=1940285 RepID=UPI003D0E7F6B